MTFTNPLVQFEPLGAGRQVAESTLANWAALSVEPSGSTLPWFPFHYELASAIDSQRPPDHPMYRAEYWYRLQKPSSTVPDDSIYITAFRVQTNRQAQTWYTHMRTCCSFFYGLGADWDQTFSPASIAAARDYLATVIPVEAAERGAYYHLRAAMWQLTESQRHAAEQLTEEMMARSQAEALAFMKWVLIDWLAGYSIDELYGESKQWPLNQHRGYLLYTMALSFEH
jgi:hypothetical protein